jgi:hypothetical protein
LLTAQATVHSSCEAVRSINAGSAGIMGLNGSVQSLTSYIVFADQEGQLLFVYFNNNTMATNLKIGVPNINNVASTNVQYIYTDPDVDDIIV